jgi:predicted lipoprotein with Yx(FWY)xxD motif
MRRPILLLASTAAALAALAAPAPASSVVPAAYTDDVRPLARTQVAVETGTYCGGLAGDHTGDRADDRGRRAGAAESTTDTRPLRLTPPPGTRLGANSTQKLGTIVADRFDCSLYRFDGDTAYPSSSTCVDACATRWLPLLLEEGEEEPVSADSLISAKISYVERPGDTKQVTLAGWPLYRFADDRPGDLKGQGVDDKWFVIGPDGEPAATRPSDSADPGSEGSATGSVTGAAADGTCDVGSASGPEASDRQGSGEPTGSRAEPSRSAGALAQLRDAFAAWLAASIGIAAGEDSDSAAGSSANQATSGPGGDRADGSYGAESSEAQEEAYPAGR